MLAAAGAGAGGVASFALGTCHDSGGFCADRFSSTHVEAYAGGVLLVSSAVALLTLTVTRRRVAVAAAGLISGIFLVLLVSGA